MVEELISVIVPVYKVEAYLDECVASILGQMYRNLELILVDDGSPDNCGTMCDAWAQKDERVRVIHQENVGLSGARNTGVDKSSGKWIAFVDSDDAIHPQMLEKLYRAVHETEGARIACARFERQDEVSQEWMNARFAQAESMRLQGNDLWNFFYANEINTQMVVAWNKLYDRELFSHLKYPLGRIHEDEFLTYRLLYQAQTVAWVDQPLYCYRQRAGSIMSSENTKAVLDAMEAFVQRSAFVQEHLPEFAVKDYEVFTGHVERAELLCAEDPQALAKIRRWGRQVFCRMYGKLPADQKRGGAFHYMLPELYKRYRRLKEIRKGEGTASFLHGCTQQAEEVKRLIAQGTPKEAEGALTSLIARLWRNRDVELSAADRRVYRRLCRYAGDGYRRLAAKTGKKSMLARAAALYVGMDAYAALVGKRHPEALGLPAFDPQTLEKFAAQLRQFPQGRRFILLQTPEHGNLGDHAIAMAERRFLQKYFPTVPVIELPGFAFSSAAEKYKALLDRQRDTILIHGGGFIGSLWAEQEDNAQILLKKLKDFRIVVLPQTIFYDDETSEQTARSLAGYKNCPGLLMLVREEYSYQRAQRLLREVNFQLVPDMVLQLRYKGPRPQRKGIGLCLRSDKEGVLNAEAKARLAEMMGQTFPEEQVVYTDTVLPQDVPVQDREAAVQAKLEEFAGYKLMVTDRLHGMVFAALTGTPCLVLDNCDHKVRGVYEWVRQNPYLLYLDAPGAVAQALQMIGPMLEEEHQFDPGQTQAQFDRLARLLE